MASGAACAQSTAPRVDSRACPQTNEFGNYGCARLTVVVAAPREALPDSYRFDVRATRVHVESGFDVAYAPSSMVGANPLQLIRWLSGVPRGTDTASVWVSARILNAVNAVVGQPLTVFAADSALRLVYFAPVGGIPVVDTVRLALRLVAP